MESLHFPEQIEGETIWIRRHSSHEAKALFAAIDQDRERLRKFLPWVDFTQTLEDEENYLENAQQKWEEQEFFAYTLYRKSDGELIGTGNVHSISWKNECCELGYVIFSEFEGQGFVSDYVRTIEKVCFDLGFFRVEIRCDAKNTRSAAVPLRNGYQKEAHLRSDTVFNGRRRGTLIFAKLRTDSQADDIQR
jgi:ribosomal-protein-serine acetyltransferase